MGNLQLAIMKGKSNREIGNRESAPDSYRDGNKFRVVQACKQVSKPASYSPLTIHH